MLAVSKGKKLIVVLRAFKLVTESNIKAISLHLISSLVSKGLRWMSDHNRLQNWGQCNNLWYILSSY